MKKTRRPAQYSREAFGTHKVIKRHPSARANRALERSPAKPSGSSNRRLKSANNTNGSLTDSTLTSREPGGATLIVGANRATKSAAVAALARELGRRLSRIDLSAVISRYIGETENNLNQLFAQAQRAGAMLFFDDADALFGTRSDVKDSHDRYTNMQINYLLQQLQAHPELEVLSVNQLSPSDEAFARRLYRVIKIPRKNK